MAIFQIIIKFVVVLAILILSIIAIVKSIIGVRNDLRTGEDYNIKIFTYVLMFLMFFPTVVYVMDRYDLPTKLNFTANLNSNEAWFDFVSSYVGTVAGTIFSAVVLLIVTKMQIEKTFENEKKKAEIENYKKEKSLLNLYKETIIETRDNINTFFNWLKRLKDLEIKDSDGNDVNIYLIEYKDFIKRYWFNIAEEELKNAYLYIKDDVLKEVVFMIGQSRYVLNTICDKEIEFKDQIMKAEKIKVIEQEIDDGSEKSIFSVLNKTEEIIDKRIIVVENIIKK